MFVVLIQILPDAHLLLAAGSKGEIGHPTVPEQQN